MKKRKELDALLTMANGKKNGKSKRSKDGHELLRLDSDSNSSDNEELFLAPKKTVIRRPRNCQCCGMCVPVIMFILTMGCMVVTGGLIWMHFTLKQDFDALRKSLQDVQQKAEIASTQQSTLMDLESRLQRMSDIPEKVDTSAIKIKKLNESLEKYSKEEEFLRLANRVTSVEATVKANPSVNVQDIAKNGHSIQEIRDLLDTAIADVETLKSQVEALQHPPTTQGALLTPSLPQATTRGSTPPVSSAGDGVQGVSEELPKLWSAIHNVTNAVESLAGQHHELELSVAVLQRTVANISTLPSPTSSHTSVPSQNTETGQYDLATMQADIELLKVECNRSSESISPSLVVPPQPGAVDSTVVSQLTDRMERIEEQVRQLNPEDLNNNLLNENTTNQVQFLLERSMERFKNENFADFTQLNGSIGELRKNITELSKLNHSIGEINENLERVNSFQDEVGERIASINQQLYSLRNCSATACATQTDTPQTQPGKQEEPIKSTLSPEAPAVPTADINQGSATVNGTTE